MTTAGLGALKIEADVALRVGGRMGPPTSFTLRPFFLLTNLNPSLSAAALPDAAAVAEGLRLSMCLAMKGERGL